MNKPLVKFARRASARRASQRGAVAIVVGLTLVVLVGMVGLAIDGGHLYLTKTELQNASDACALAASYNLTGSPISQAAFVESDAAGRTVAKRNKVDFQGSDIADADVTIKYGTTLAEGGSWLTASSNPPGESKYVRCTLQRTGITPYLMQVLGFGDQTVSSLATATLAPSQSNCAIPMGLCTRPGGSPPEYGYGKGTWYGLNFKDTGSPDANYTGNFRWIDFDPNSPTPGCPGGGSSELACVMRGTGQCSLPPPPEGSCEKSGGVVPPGCVGEGGNITGLQAAYNSRFGVYRNGGGANLTTAPPDFTGYSFDGTIWTLGHDAYGGTSGSQTNFKTARTLHLSTQTGLNSETGKNFEFVPNSYSPTGVEDHTTYGADRRLVVVPIVDCTAFEGGQNAPIRAYACVLLLDPYRKGSDPGTKDDVISQFEYLGLAKTPGSPCASSGVTGDDSSQGPLVPSLVQ